jgi:hypothetical protein
MVDVQQRGIVGSDGLWAVVQLRNRCVGPGHAVQRRQDVDKLCGQPIAVTLFKPRLVLRDKRHHRVALRLLAKEERCTQNAGVVAAPENARKRHRAAFERLHRQCPVGCKKTKIGPKPQNQILPIGWAFQPRDGNLISQPGEAHRKSCDLTDLNRVADLGGQVGGNAPA